MKERIRKRGSTLLEFTLVGIPIIFVLISTVKVALGMWNYNSMANATEQAARYASVRGADCACLTVNGIARQVAYYGIGLDASKLDVSLVSASGTTACNPVTACYGNAAAWPPAADATAGSNIQIQASYPFAMPIAMFWPGQRAVRFNSATLGAASTQVILY